MFNQKEYDKKYREEHKEERKKNWDRWYLEHKKERNEYKKQYRSEYSDREYQKQYYHKKYKHSLKYQINRNIRRAIDLSLKGNKNGRHWEDLVGYALKDLIKHLKETIPEGYVWNDYLKGRLHIDHIIPKSVFNYSTPEHTDFQNCWALNNLRLLPARENQIKSNHLDKPFQPALKI